MFTISPQVVVSEIDATTGIPAVSTSEAAIAGVFRWGPVGERVLVTSEPELVSQGSTSQPTSTQKPGSLQLTSLHTEMHFTSHVQRLVPQLLLCSLERLLLTLHSDDQQRGSLRFRHGGILS
jgi:hypothetical protein